jgi:hypothetical protein
MPTAGEVAAADGVDAGVTGIKMPALDAAMDGPAAEAKRQQLSPRHHPFLPIPQGADPVRHPGFLPHTVTFFGWISHRESVSEKSQHMSFGSVETL